MVKKYARLLEERDTNERTGEVWKITDVPNTWNARVLVKIEEDGFIVDTDGTVIPRPVNEA